MGLEIARLACAGALLVTPSTLHAQEAPAPPLERPVSTRSSTSQPDYVLLRDGGLVRGRVQEILPGDHISVSLETGGVRRIAWVDVDRVIVASASTGSLSVPALATADRPPNENDASSVGPAMRGPLVRVHIKTSKHVELNRRPIEGASWELACGSPCDVDLPLEDEYEIAGLGRGPTRPFRLKGSPGQALTLTIRPPSTGGIVVGGLLAVVGGVASYISTAAVAASASSDPGSSSAALTAMAVSGGALAAGIAVWIVSARTDVLQVDGAPSFTTETATFRQPVWHPPEEVGTGPA